MVRDLDRKRPIRFGGDDRSTLGMDMFHEWLGPRKARKIRLAVMDMRNPFSISLEKEGHAPQAAILFDMFHAIRCSPTPRASPPRGARH